VAGLLFWKTATEGVFKFRTAKNLDVGRRRAKKGGPKQKALPFAETNVGGRVYGLGANSTITHAQTSPAEETRQLGFPLRKHTEQSGSSSNVRVAGRPMAAGSCRNSARLPPLLVRAFG